MHDVYILKWFCCIVAGSARGVVHICAMNVFIFLLPVSHCVSSSNVALLRFQNGVMRATQSHPHISDCMMDFTNDKLHVWLFAVFCRQMASDYGPWPFIAGVSMIMWSFHKIWKAKGVYWWRKLTGVNLPPTARYMLPPPKEIGQVFLTRQNDNNTFTFRSRLVSPSRFSKLTTD